MGLQRAGHSLVMEQAIFIKIDSQQGPTVKQRNYTQYLIIIYDGKESEIYIYIYKTKSLCCTPEVNSTL